MRHARIGRDWPGGHGTHSQYKSTKYPKLRS